MIIHQPTIALLAFVAVAVSSLCNMVILSHSQTPFFKGYRYHGHFDFYRDVYRAAMLIAIISFAGSFTDNTFFLVSASLGALNAAFLIVATFNISRKS